MVPNETQKSIELQTNSREFGYSGQFAEMFNQSVLPPGVATLWKTEVNFTSLSRHPVKQAAAQK
jgi:hypothetical protein